MIFSIGPIRPVSDSDGVVVAIRLPAIVAALVVRAHDRRPGVHDHPTFAGQGLAVSGKIG